MAKVLLASPRWATSFPEQPPMSLLYLGAYLRELGHNIQICDVPLGDDFGVMLDLFKPDVVGINSPTCGIGMGYGMAKFAKSKGYYTIMGGPHVSAMPLEATNFCDTVVIGEGERILAKLIESRQTGIVKGEPIPDINKLPMPAFDMINMDFYTMVRKKVGNSLYAYVDICDRLVATMTSRGCPFKCIYCYNSSINYDTPVRYKSAEKVIEEMEFLRDNYKADSVAFLDDDFVLNKKRLEKICEYLTEAKIYWSANSRATDVDEDMAEMVYNAGCVQLAFGLESYNDRILKILGKQAVAEDAKRAVEICHKTGIVVQSNFMFGSPTETEEEMMNTLKFMKESNIDGGLGASAVVPFPATKIWEWCIENNKIKGKVDWGQFNYSSYPINMSNVPDARFKEIMHEVATYLNFNLTDKEPIRTGKLKKWKESHGVKPKC